MADFNLVDDPWLPLRPRGGGPVRERSLRSALVEADSFEALALDLPTQLPAVLRQVLLPVVLDALGVPESRCAWARWFAAGGFARSEKDELNSYLDKYRHRFALFSKESPFAQAAGLRTGKDEVKTAALLVATVSSGNNVPLFGSHTDNDPLWLSPAEAARWLVHTHCWDTAGIKTAAAEDPQAKQGKVHGSPTGPLGQLGVLVPIGSSLFDTLMLNTPITSQHAAGTPQWRRAPAGPEWGTRSADGVLDLFTWQARRVRLVPEETEHGTYVRHVVLTAGDRLQPLPDWEPHTAWQHVKDPKSPTGMRRRPRRHGSGTADWRGLPALLAVERENAAGATGYETSTLLTELAGLSEDGALADDYPLRLATSGIAYGTHFAVIEDVVHDAIPVPIAALRADEETYSVVIEVCQQAEQLARAVDNLSADLRRASGAQPISGDKGFRPGPQVLQALDTRVRRLLAGVQQAAGDSEVLQRGQLAWEQVAWRETRRIATTVVASAPQNAFLGRSVKNNGSTRLYSLGTAEANFTRSLSRILPRAYEAHQYQSLLNGVSAGGTA